MGYICPDCGHFIEGEASSLFWHLRNIHNAIVGHTFVKTILCKQEGCQRTYSGHVGGYKKHLLTAHPAQERQNPDYQTEAVLASDDDDACGDGDDDGGGEVNNNAPWDDLDEHHIDMRAAMIVAELLASFFKTNLEDKPEVPERSRQPTSAFSPRAIISQIPNGSQYIRELEAGLMSYATRKEVVQVLVSWLMEKFSPIELKPPSHLKLKLARTLVTEFPLLRDSEGEGYEAWYSPADNEREASGYLEYRARNVRRRSNKNAPVAQKLPKSSISSAVVVDLTDDEDEDVQQAKKEWLKNNNEPAKQVGEYMAATAKIRASWIRENSDVTIPTMLEEYPHLLLLDGKYVLADFRILYPSACDRLFMKWTIMAPKIVEYADAQQRVEWRKSTEAVQTDAEVFNAAFYALSSVMPPGMIKAGKGKGKLTVQRASLAEAKSSFIDVQPIGTNIPLYMESSTCKTQPRVLVLGNRIKPEQVFVLVEKHIMSCKSIIAAVDLAFKIAYILWTDYPWQATYTWDVLRKVFYGLGEGRGKEKQALSTKAIRAFLTQPDR